MFCDKGVLKISQSSQENTCIAASILIKSNFTIKGTPMQGFSCEFGKFLREVFLRISPVPASEYDQESNKDHRTKKLYPP